MEIECRIAFFQFLQSRPASITTLYCYFITVQPVPLYYSSKLFYKYLDYGVAGYPQFINIQKWNCMCS